MFSNIGLYADSKELVEKLAAIEPGEKYWHHVIVLDYHFKDYPKAVERPLDAALARKP
ncbi:MAG: hypothetical protein IIA70_08135 [Proteobacteria bacterium]|nr:hypothetical protein [Pseudomonadota bacterium]